MLAVFHQKNAPDWRLTYAARRTTLDEETFAITQIETAPRRFTFLLGSSEPCKTAAARLASLLEKTADLKLADVEKAFSIKKLLGRLVFLAFLQRKGWLHVMEKGFATPFTSPAISPFSAKGLQIPSPYD